MQLFDEAVFDLLMSGTITIDEAHSRAMDKDALSKKVATMGVRFDTREPSKDGGDGAGLLERRQGIVNMYLEELRKTPDNPEVLNNLAWLLATADNPDADTVERALAMAQKAHALTKGQHAGVLDTLGAAHAQSGHFDKALDAARKGLKLARASQQTELADALERRIKLYEQGQPMRDD